MRSQKLLALGLAFTVAVSGAYAADYYVDLNYSGTESGTETEPYTNIRPAVVAANANAGADTIYIAAGTYDDAR
jgi:hypothetical protein